LTARQALKEAQRRWGKTAVVEDIKHASYMTKKDGTKWMISDRFKVGRIMLGMFFEVLGDGPTWEAAFAKVDENIRKQQEMIAQLRMEAKS
jgi:hypothetical protein